MANFANVGTYDAGVIKFPGNASGNAVSTMDAAGIASGGAFLVSELEKRDPMLRKPLTSFTYPRDIVIQTGGGWVDYISAMSVGYGVTGGSGASLVQAGGSDGIPIVQANVDKGVYKAHAVALALRVMFQDMQRANFIGRSIDQLVQDGIRLTYDKHMDQNVYTGFAEYNTTGLINNPDATESTVADGASGNGNWATKTPLEILQDVNTALTATWAQAEYDLDAIPNHILIPYEEYTYIMNTPFTLVTSGAQVAFDSIYDYIKKHNITNANGGDLFIGATQWCKGAGTGGTDRMVVYTNHERFVKMDELVPLTRSMTAPNPEHFCYDTAYAANISEVQVMYPQTITYWDHIGGDT